METIIGLTIQQRQASTDVLNQTLANLIVLSAKARFYGWHAIGPNTGELQHMFSRQHQALEKAITQIAHRIRTLDRHTVSSLQGFVSLSQLDESLGQETPEEMISNLLQDHERLIFALRKDIVLLNNNDDLGTQALLTGLLRRHEEMTAPLRVYAS